MRTKVLVGLIALAPVCMGDSINIGGVLRTNVYVTQDNAFYYVFSSTNTESEPDQISKRMSQLRDVKIDLQDPKRIAFFRQIDLRKQETKQADQVRKIHDKDAALRRAESRIDSENSLVDSTQSQEEISLPETISSRTLPSSEIGNEAVLFHDTSRTPSYRANYRASFDTRREAIAALATQFGESSEWIESNMGSSNSLPEIHRQLNRAKLKTASANFPLDLGVENSQQSEYDQKSRALSAEHHLIAETVGDSKISAAAHRLDDLDERARQLRDKASSGTATLSELKEMQIEAERIKASYLNEMSPKYRALFKE